MRVISLWSGGKDGYTGLHKAVEQGHEVAYLLTSVFADPYIFHSYLIMELQSKALGIPHLKIKIEERHQNPLELIAPVIKGEGIEGLVTGDIESEHHKHAWEDACKKLGLELITPLWDAPPYPGNRYRERVLDMELSTGMKAIINCIDLKFLGEEWLGREFNRSCVQEMKALVGPPGVGIDATGEFAEFHTTVLDSPLFKESIEITKFTKKRLVTDHGGMPPTVDAFYMDIEEAFLRPKRALRFD